MTPKWVDDTKWTRIATPFLNIHLYRSDYKPEFQELVGLSCQFGVMADKVQAIVEKTWVVHSNSYI